jgi:uncharacterized lipoprotein
MSVAALGGCASMPTAVNYSPSSVLNASGSLAVGEFEYLPAKPSPTEPDRSPVASNQIRNTAIGDIKIDRDVNVFVRDAVFSELRFVGIKINDGRRVLKGSIEEFLADDLGYSVDWTLRVRYELSDPAAKKVLYQSVKNTQRKTAKFGNVFGALNETIKLHAEELIKDAAFLKAIQ